MKTTAFACAALGALLAAAPALAQMGSGPGMMGQGRMGGGPGMMGGSAVRHRLVMHYGVDPQYAGKRNPLRATPEEIDAGSKLFAQNCAACHGPQGRGDGPAAKGLNPPPADLAGLGGMPIATDGFLYWTIAEGGAPVKSAMPPFKAGLKDRQIWQLILFLRTL